MTNENGPPLGDTGLDLDELERLIEQVGDGYSPTLHNKAYKVLPALLAALRAAREERESERAGNIMLKALHRVHLDAIITQYEQTIDALADVASEWGQELDLLRVMGMKVEHLWLFLRRETDGQRRIYTEKAFVDAINDAFAAWVERKERYDPDRRWGAECIGAGSQSWRALRAERDATRREVAELRERIVDLEELGGVIRLPGGSLVDRAHHIRTLEGLLAQCREAVDWAGEPDLLRMIDIVLAGKEGSDE